LQQATLNFQRAQATCDLTMQEIEAQRYEREILKQQVALAELALKQLQAGGIASQFQQAVAAAQLAVDRLAAQVAEARLVAPMAGQVLSLSVSADRPAEAFKPVIVIIDPATIEVSADLLADSQLQELSEGQEVVVTLRSYPGQTWHGAIRRLPYPYGAGGAQGLAGEDNSTRISLKGDLGNLQLGELAYVVVVVEEKDNVLWLPPAALRTFQGRKFVIIQDAGQPRRVDVTIGVESADRVEILEGLEEGQIVVGQ